MSSLKTRKNKQHCRNRSRDKAKMMIANFCRYPPIRYEIKHYEVPVLTLCNRIVYDRYDFQPSEDDIRHEMVTSFARALVEDDSLFEKRERTNAWGTEIIWYLRIAKNK